MGMLSQLRPSAAAQNLFNTSGLSQGQTDAVKNVMDFVNKNPLLMEAVSIAFPPARAAIAVTALASKINHTLSSGASLEQTTEAYRQTQPKEGEAPKPIAERLQSMLEIVTGTPVKQRTSQTQR